MAMATQVGLHRIEIEGDIVITRLRGAFTLEHMEAWCRLADAVIAEHGGLFSLSDFSAGGSISPESRRYVGEWSGAANVRGIALFGASTPLRILMSMIVRAGALLRSLSIPLTNVRSEADARLWVAEQRAKKTGSQK